MELQSFGWLRLGSVIEFNRTHPKILPIEHNRTFGNWTLKQSNIKPVSSGRVSNKVLRSNTLCIRFNFAHGGNVLGKTFCMVLLCRSCFPVLIVIRGGSRGRVQGVRTPPEMTSGFLIQLVFRQKKNWTMWFIGVEVEQETSAPPPRKNRGSAPVIDFESL